MIPIELIEEFVHQQVIYIKKTNTECTRTSLLESFMSFQYKHYHNLRHIL